MYKIINVSVHVIQPPLVFKATGSMVGGSAFLQFYRLKVPER